MGSTKITVKKDPASMYSQGQKHGVWAMLQDATLVALSSEQNAGKVARFHRAIVRFLCSSR
jgi:hypothetical protein